jgi:hypothetical protein
MIEWWQGVLVLLLVPGSLAFIVFWSVVSQSLYLVWLIIRRDPELREAGLHRAFAVLQSKALSRLAVELPKDDSSRVSPPKA